MESVTDTDTLVSDTRQPPLINIGSGQESSIRDLTALVAHTVGYQGSIEWDRSKPDGTPRKLLDVTKMNARGWRASIPLSFGLAQTYQSFLSSL